MSKKKNMDDHHSSVDPSAPTILRPRFESQAHHLRFYQFIFELCDVKRTKINKKRARQWPTNKKTKSMSNSSLQSASFISFPLRLAGSFKSFQFSLHVYLSICGSAVGLCVYLLVFLSSYLPTFTSV